MVLIHFIECQAIAYSTHGMDEFLLEGIVNLAAQVADVDIHHIGLVEGIGIPNVLRNLVRVRTFWFPAAFERRKFLDRQWDCLLRRT
jgi:hypothetical protein